MLIDSHCHLPENVNEATRVIEDSKLEGVEKLINIGTHISDIKIAIDSTKIFKGVYTTAGIYPQEELDTPLETLRLELEKFTKLNIVAIGECGFDVVEHMKRSIENQARLFEMQIQLAIEKNLPIIIHNRNADSQTLTMLEKYKSPKLRGVAHCFASSWKVAQKYLNLGFYISFSGLITYPTRNGLLETVQKVPLDKFLVETDSPFLPPQGHRGEVNEPKYVKIVAQKVAEIKNLPFEQICSQSYHNTCKIFTGIQ